jgi:hypothetical protein
MPSPDSHEHEDGHEDEGPEPSMDDRVGPSKNELDDLFGGRPGWRLEPRLTPGATPLWCFVAGGKIEFSVEVVDNSIRLYLVATDKEIVFDHVDELTAWLKTHRAAALQEPAARHSGKSRFRKLFEWN